MTGGAVPTADAVRLKDPAGIAGIAAAGRVVADVLRELAAAVAPGVRTAELADLAEDRIRAAGGSPTFLGHRGFRGAICVSPADVVVHGIPGARRLAAGELVSLDVGVTLDGWIADAARTVGVGELDPVARHLRDTTEAAMHAGAAACRPGARTGDVGAAVDAVVRAAGLQVFPTLTGHGVGRALHEEPRVPNHGAPGTGHPLEEGLVLCVEPMVAGGRPRVRLEGDGWTVRSVDGAQAAHSEVTVAVTAEGPRVLTPWAGPA